MMCSSMHETSTGASLCVPAAVSLRAGEGAGAYEAHVYPDGCAAGAATLQQSGAQAEQGSLAHAALIYDYVVQDPRLAEELKSFVDNLIDEGLDKTWEQVMAGALTRTNTRKHPQTRTCILFMCTHQHAPRVMYASNLLLLLILKLRRSCWSCTAHCTRPSPNMSTNRTDFVLLRICETPSTCEFSMLVCFRACERD